jgi:hypothetical protein
MINQQPYYAYYPYAQVPDYWMTTQTAYQPQVPVQYAAPAYPLTPVQSNGSLLTSSSFIKGALIGAAAAYVMSNDTVQQAFIKTSVKAWSMLQGGVEEMKERFRDAEAELHSEHLEE